MKVFVFYTCDQWKSRDSMRVAMIFKDSIEGRKKLAEFVWWKSHEMNEIELDSSVTLKDCHRIAVYNTPLIFNDYMEYGFIEIEEVEG